MLGHRNYRIAEDHIGPFVFVAVSSDADLQTLLSYRYEFLGAHLLPRRIRNLTILPNDPANGGV